ncbi:hypothetical protein BKA67DRAFT_537645 [Truncatella angustata]|uniref:Uncharacterized protein n=1 Tax=Truncatella angustata TaxID=152316 RepID=A0A9P8UGH8_9PEZI|nr:uncharacterized protein BKA67DRAFT_537645 [Truncatella angustata]KAH6651789.1 hypothetical protein BKA67DRAFT_537645 [Truncatella angustata]KAH8196330.1 hypothetical protein TruAng_009508 [Truncatella angustata]
MTSTREQPKHIPVVVVGITRDTALAVGKTFFVDTPYFVSAALDLTESPAPFQYSPANLAVVLNALHPRPRALVTGTAVPDDMLHGIVQVWNDYVANWKVDGVWVALSKTHPSTGPPPPGTGEEMMKQLGEKFES